MRWEKVFISYDMQDIELANALAKPMARVGIEPFLASDYIAVGMKIQDKVTKAIDDSNCFVPLLTKISIQSQWVNQEVAYAVTRSRSTELGIFPVVEQGVNLKGLLDQTSEYIPLDRSQVDETIYLLLSTLRAYINRNFEALSEITIRCGICGMLYRIDLPPEDVIQGAAQQNRVLPTKCNRCLTQNNLNPKTFAVGSSFKVAY